VTIRRTLLRAFLLVGLVPVVLVALVGFSRASRALQDEIEHGLAAQAEAVASDIDKLVYERLQNAATWSRLEVMQDLQVGDVDKRLSAFLQRLQRGYGGLYLGLSAADRLGRTVAAGDAAGLGAAAPMPSVWQSVELDGQALSLSIAPAGGPKTGLLIRAPVASAFASGALGELRLWFDWGQVDQLLDQAADGGRLVALVDGQGRVVAGSKRLLARLPRHAADLAAWAGGAASARLVEGRAPLHDGPLIVGSGQARGYAGFAGLGWRVLVLVPRDEALAPVRSMGWIFVALLAVVALGTTLVAGWTSQAIARPIAALTGFTRRYRHGGDLARLPPAQRGEVGELRDAFVHMVQEIEQSQQRLARASALAAVGEMSAVIAHEVRTPLGILRSSSQVLQRESGLSDEGRELLGFIESETERLNGLVSQMLDSARPRPPQMAATDVHELIHRVVVLLTSQAETKGVRFSLQLQAAQPELACDGEQMMQVLLNLVLNGLQILGRGGEIAIATLDDAQQLTIEVADDGPGIAPESRARIFEAFFFQREGGLGLGLAVVQRIVVAHGGDIEAGQSRLGGALFRIRLPRTVLS